MPKITIDGTEIEVEKGTTVIQAAETLGIEVPRYCYHPGLSIVGVCRICLVEIERMPKLQVACYTPVTEGMVVQTNSEKVLEARKAVLEFLLINHPLDCPVCDQAGECWLQNYYMQHGLYDSKMVEDKVKKQKALPIGPNVMLDSERCILCSRCVRFCDEISKTHELGIFNRGDHAELLPYSGRELDNMYSGNTIDVCPVGALTDRDFRFRTRVWYLSETKSVCPGCSNGCNIYLHHNEKRPYKADGMRVSRIKPRYNPDVNQWWICDEGRYGFTHVDAPTRILHPQRKVEGNWQQMNWLQTIAEVGAKISSVIEKHGSEAFGVLLSPKLTLEDLFLARKLFSDILKLKNVDAILPPLTPGYSDDFLIKADKNPNAKGVDLLGLTADSYGGLNAAQLLQAAANGELNALYICQHDLEEGFEMSAISNALEKLELVVFQGTNGNPSTDLAHYLLPSAAFVEKDGTFVNYGGRLQRIHKAVEPLGESRPDWMIFRNLAKQLGTALPYFETADIFDAIAEQVLVFRGMSYEAIGDSGMDVNGKVKTVEMQPTEEEQRVSLW